MDIVRLMLLSRQMKNRRHEKDNMVTGIPPLTFTANKKGLLKNYRIYGNTETLTRSYSGTAPLSFPIVDGAVSNYRIYGNTENGESVGDLVTDSQSEYYGKYAIPITNNSETVNIYLDEPLTRQGNNADYIDYAEQKRYNADGTSEDVTLPALPAHSSTNSLSIGTTVQPSSVAVDVDEIVGCGDRVTDSQSVNYGKYKIPVTLTADSAETTDIYLDTPLCKVGNESDYIDYVEQKQHKVRKNLFDGYKTTDIINNSYIDQATGNIISHDSYYISYPIAVIANQNYVWTFNSFRKYYTWRHNAPTVGFYDVNNVLISVATHDKDINSFMFTVPANCLYVRASVYKYGSVNKTEAMLNFGAEPLPYEPYIANTEVDVTLPAISTLAGTNTLTVGTEVQPSRVELTGRIKEAQTNGSGNT